MLTKFVYLNLVAFPFFADLRQPELLLNNTISLYLTTEPGVTVGIWHTVPGSRGAEAVGKDQRWYEEALADAYPVIIYLHGNGGTRAASHRVQFLKTMGAADFHILALDYRGYGDSSGHPTESGFTTDVLALYDWAKARSGNSSILFWGHSLGTGIATNAARKLQEERGKGQHGWLSPTWCPPPGGSAHPWPDFGGHIGAGEPRHSPLKHQARPPRWGRVAVPLLLSRWGHIALWPLPGMGAWQRPWGEDDPPVAMPAVSSLCPQASRLLL
uniref:Abhydrolase domain containing 12B n=1 Tax=Buteo japonicus TaxID=224669 RepID=A0A8B9Z576_9AVES